MILKCWYLLHKARKMRNSGKYDYKTLCAFAEAVRCSSFFYRLWPLMEYWSFLRDLGKSPRSMDWVKIKWLLIFCFPCKWTGVFMRFASESKPEFLQNGCCREIIRRPTPVIAAYCKYSKFKKIADIHLLQSQWQQDFHLWLEEKKRFGNICVVGNSASLKGGALGEKVDEQAAVVRFNHWADKTELMQDVGAKIDVWVVSPGYRGPVPKNVSWVVVAGPDVRYTLRNWLHLMPLIDKGVPILTIPLPVWRKAVRVLKAPPSSGVLFLQWIHDLLRGWESIKILGIGDWEGQGAYHLSLPEHQAATRHHWVGEQGLIKMWTEHGLQRLNFLN